MSLCCKVDAKLVLQSKYMVGFRLLAELKYLCTKQPLMMNSNHRDELQTYLVHPAELRERSVIHERNYSELLLRSWVC